MRNSPAAVQSQAALDHAMFLAAESYSVARYEEEDFESLKDEVIRRQVSVPSRPFQ